MTGVLARNVITLLALAVWAAAGPASATEKNGKDEVLATVGGREIHQSDLDRSKAGFGQALAPLPVLGGGDPELERYINFRLIAEAARDAGLEDDPEVHRTIEQMADLILYRTFISSFVTEVASEDALRKIYDEKYQDGKGLEQVHAFHIRVKDRDAAEEVIKALKGGADFAYLAKEHSVAPSAKDGGDLGFIGRGDRSPAFMKAALALDPGKVTEEPVEIDSGWEIIRVEARRLRKAPGFDKAKSKLADQAIDKAITALLTKLREQNGLESESAKKPEESGSDAK